MMNTMADVNSNEIDNRLHFDQIELRLDPIRRNHYPIQSEIDLHLPIHHRYIAISYLTVIKRANDKRECLYA